MVFVTKANTHSSLLLPVREVVLQSLSKNSVEEQAGQRITLFGPLFDLENVAFFISHYFGFRVSV